MGSVRVAIVGVGNCATSLIQGVEYYKDADPAGTVPGLMHVRFGDYHVSDIEFVAAFDVDAKKVGFDLADATQASENNTIRICDVPPTGVTVQRGHTFDGLGKYYQATIEESDSEPVDIVSVLKDTQADVLVSYLPVGSEKADKFYAQCAIDAGVAFVNALPVFIASDPEWAKKFEDAGVPIIGDDIKSQVGATITHRVLAKLFEDRGVVLDRTYQLNVGGNMDFKNMLERERLESKKVSKTQAVTSNLTGPLSGLVDSKNVSAVQTQAEPIAALAKRRGIQVVWGAVQNPATAREELATIVRDAVRTMRKNDPDLSKSLFWVTGSTSVFREMKTINENADRVPVVSVVPEVVKAGDDTAVLAIGISFESNAHLAAIYAANILDGRAKAGDLKVGVVSPPDIAISFRKAREIGLRVPFTFFESASFVYDYDGRAVRATANKGPADN